jgi:SAM-dependent methyltransferase
MSAGRVRLSTVVDALAARPRAFDALRWVLEAGFVGERRVLARERCDEATRLLDLGCGTGALAGSFSPEGYVGVDVNRRYIERARMKHVRHRFLVMDGLRLAFQPAAFDVVVVGGVIHHLADDEAGALLKEARRVLRTETGRLVAWEDVPTRQSWNVVGRLVHYLDAGDAIRPSPQYLELVEAIFPHVRHYPMRSGVCDYVVMVAGRSHAAIEPNGEARG